MIPCRCNKRPCQARRSLRRRPEGYVRPPRCHRPGCKGFMYAVDRSSDNPPTCHRPCYPFPHRVNSPRCEQYQEYVLERAMRFTSKHNPNQHHDDGVPF